MEMKDCIFCQIGLGKIPAKVVYQDSSVLAFLDINPANKGHVLIIPKRHFTDLVEIPEHELKTFMGAVKRVAEGVLKGTKASGFNIVQNNSKVAGQIIPHLHFHVIPRFDDDGLDLGTWRHLKYESEDEMNTLRDSIASNVLTGEVETPKIESKPEILKPPAKTRNKKEISFVKRELMKA